MSPWYLLHKDREGNLLDLIRVAENEDARFLLRDFSRKYNFGRVSERDERKRALYPDAYRLTTSDGKTHWLGFEVEDDFALKLPDESNLYGIYCGPRHSDEPKRVVMKELEELWEAKQKGKERK